MIVIFLFHLGNPKRGRYKTSKGTNEVPEPEMFVQYQNVAYSKPDDVDIETVLANFERTQLGRKVAKEELKKVLKKNKEQMGRPLTNGVPKGAMLSEKHTNHITVSPVIEPSCDKNIVQTYLSAQCNLKHQEDISKQEESTSCHSSTMENMNSTEINNTDQQSVLKQFAMGGITDVQPSLKFDPVIASVVHHVDEMIHADERDVLTVPSKNHSKLEPEPPNSVNQIHNYNIVGSEGSLENGFTDILDDVQSEGQLYQSQVLPEKESMKEDGGYSTNTINQEVNNSTVPCTSQAQCSTENLQIESQTGNESLTSTVEPKSW